MNALKSAPDPVDVLIVCDDAELVDLLRRRLSADNALDCSATFEPSLEGALALLDDEDWSLVVIDLETPEPSSRRIFEQLAEWSKLVPVVALVADSEPAVERAALHNDIDATIRKDWLSTGIFELTVTQAVERHRTEQQLKLYELAVENAKDPIIIKDIDGHYQLVNQSAAKVIGRPASEVLGKTDEELLSQEAAASIRNRHELALERGEPVSEEENLDLPGGAHRFLTTQIPFQSEGEWAGTIGMARDITELQQLEQQALYDHLTGLPSRILFRDRLSRLLERSGQLAVAVVNIDNFNVVNNGMGRDAGDAVLRIAGERLQSHLDSCDTVAHMSGDEFALICDRIDARSDLQSLAQMIEECFEAPFELPTDTLHISVTVGFAYRAPSVLTAGGVDHRADMLIRTADQAMRQAKETPGTSWQILTPDEETSGPSEIRIENDMRRGLARGEFVPHYQPLFELETGRLWAIELLARWRHAEYGLVSPGVFIPVAERTGLLQQVTDQLLVGACRDVAEADLPDDWELPVRLNLNISPNQIAQRDIVSRLTGALDDADCDDQLLDIRLEITEAQILERNDRVQKLREHGFRIVVDDFGTGYSSLSRIKDLPMDELKLDMEFVQGAVDNAGDAAIVRTVIELGRQLGVPVVGEGVETEGQLRLLERAGCDAAQGFYYGRPAPLADCIRTTTKVGDESD